MHYCFDHPSKYECITKPTSIKIKIITCKFLIKIIFLIAYKIDKIHFIAKCLKVIKNKINEEITHIIELIYQHNVSKKIIINELKIIVLLIIGFKNYKFFK